MTIQSAVYGIDVISILYFDIYGGDYLIAAFDFVADALFLCGGQQGVHGIHIAVYGCIQAGSGGFQAGDHLAALFIDPDDFANIRFHFTAHGHIHIAQLPGQAPGDPGLDGKVLFRIDADHLNPDRAAVGLQGSQEGLRRGFFHSFHFHGTGRDGGIHVKSAGRALQKHVLKTDFALRFGRNQDNVRAEAGFQTVQTAAKRQDDYRTAKDSQGKESRENHQHRCPAGLSKQVSDR